MTGKPALAAQLYTVREHTKTAADFAVTIARVREMGYAAVQLSAIGPIPPEEVKRIVDSHEVAVCCTHIPWPRLTGDLENVIREHKLWGCRHVAVGSMPREYREQGAEGFAGFAHEAAAVGERLAGAGLTFSYHNHAFEFQRYGDRTGLQIIFESADPRYLWAELDTYWVQYGGGDPAAWIDRLSGRQAIIHLKDMAFVNGQAQMAEVGQGNLNWPGILAACERAGVEFAAVEQDICQRDPFESLAMSCQFLMAQGLR
ncbi:MAG: sugar phosphate isomerase/epimerase [Chloroflexi bacterium]|nr:sugar phosphate isomerase/epimerase [Chloroflexota bacterium]